MIIRGWLTYLSSQTSSPAGPDPFGIAMPLPRSPSGHAGNQVRTRLLAGRSRIRSAAVRPAAAGSSSVCRRGGAVDRNDAAPAGGVSCQANRKTREGSHHPDRNAQFDHINTTIRAAIAAGNPAISVSWLLNRHDRLGSDQNCIICRAANAIPSQARSSTPPKSMQPSPGNHYGRSGKDCAKAASFGVGCRR